MNLVRRIPKSIVIALRCITAGFVLAGVGLSPLSAAHAGAAADSLLNVQQVSIDPANQVPGVLGGHATVNGHSVVPISPVVQAALAQAAATGSAVRIGRMAASTSMSVEIVLPLKNVDGLKSLISKLYNPSDPLYGKFLTTEEFTDQFAPDQTDVDAVAAYLKSEGLSVILASRVEGLVRATGSESSIEAAFGVHINQFAAPSGRVYFANDSKPSLPSNIATKSVAILGLNTAGEGRPFCRKVAPTSKSLLAPNLFDSGISGLAPADIISIYKTAPVGTSVTAVGQSVALFEIGGYTSSDIGVYASQYSLNTPTIENVGVDNYTIVDGPNEASDEVTLDMDLMLSLAGGATQLQVYECDPNADFNSDLTDTFKAMATIDATQGLPRPSSISVSYGLSEDYLLGDTSPAQAENLALMQLAAQGQGVCISAGDSGAWTDQGDYPTEAPNTSDPGSQPFVTSVGGTDLFDSSNFPYQYGSETSWFDSNDTGRGDFGTGGGGGVSQLWPIPGYQQGSFDPTVNTQGSSTQRNVPDVSLYGDYDDGDGYSIYYSDPFFGPGWYGYNGTSASSPLWAAYLACVDQQRVTNSLSPLGFANPAIYAVAESSHYAADFHDISDGSNNGFYFAVPGYDETTGWGSFIGGHLYTDLVAYPGNIVPTPTITPNGGSFPVPQQVSINDSLGGSTIYFTTDGSTPIVGIVPPPPLTGGARSQNPTQTAGTQTYTDPFFVSVNETVKALATSVGYANSTVVSAVFIITPAPTTTDSLAGTKVSGKFVTPVTVTLTATPVPPATIVSTFYTVDGGGQTTYGTPFVLSTNGSHTITFWSVDSANNTEVAKSDTFIIGIPPTTTDSLAGTKVAGKYTTPVTVTLSATANAPATVENTYYTMDGGIQTSYTTPFVVSGNGAHTITFFSVDSQGNSETAKSDAFTIAIPPTTTDALAGTKIAGKYTTPVTVTLTATPVAPATIANTYYTVDGGGQTTYATPFVVSTNGTHTINFWSVDSQGNTESTESDSFTSSIAPTTTDALSGTKVAGKYTTAVTVTLTATAAAPATIVNTYYTLDSGGQTTYLTPFVVSTNGVHTITFWSVDSEANTESTETDTFTVGIAPTTTDSLAGTTVGSTYVTAVTVTLTATPVSPTTIANTYYTVDGGSAVSYSVPFVVSSDGSHSITFWSVDSNGNTEKTETDSFQVADSLQTTDSLAGTKVSGSYVTPVTVTLNATAVPPATIADTYYTVDGGGQQSYASPFVVSSDGSHTITFWSADSNSNIESANSDSFTIAIPPTTTDSLAGTKVSGKFVTAVTVTLTATPVTPTTIANTYYTVDGGVQTSYMTPFVVSGNGAHTITFWSVDSNSNVETTNTDTFTIAIPPVTTDSLAGTKSGSKYTTPVTVTLTATPDSPATVANSYYTIDGGSAITYSTPFTVAANGAHTITFWSVDSLGNTEIANSDSFTVAIPPTTTDSLAGTLSSGKYTTPVTVTLTATPVSPTDIQDTYYTVDGGSQTTYTSPFIVATNGSHTITFWSIDSDGNTELAGSDSFSNTIAPSTGISIVGTELGAFYSTAPTVTLIAVAVVPATITQTYYKVDGGPQTGYTAPFSISSNGSHTILYWSVDSLGNVEAFRSDHIIVAIGPHTTASYSGPKFGAIFTSSVTVTLSAVAVSPATVATTYYSVDGGSQLTYVSPFAVTGNGSHTISFWSVDSSGYTEAPEVGGFAISPPPPPTPSPTIDPNGGLFSGSVVVAITDSFNGATINYTTDGSMPTGNSPVYSRPFTLSSSSTVNAIAIVSDFSYSPVAAATFTITTATPAPTISPNGGTFIDAQVVTLTDSRPGAVYYYTVNGSTPTTGSTLYESPITVSASETINAIAIAPGYSQSSVASAYIAIAPLAATPKISPVGGSFTNPQMVTISDTQLGVTIYYTRDGSTPTAQSTKYTGPFMASYSQTIQAIATGLGLTPSDIATSAITIVFPATAPKFNPAGGTFATGQTVAITDSLAGASIYYTLDGSIPSAGSTLYNGPITVASNETVNAIAVTASSSPSAVASASYIITTPLPTPTISPDGGTFAAAKSVTITDSATGSTLYYTLDGSVPTVTSKIYTEPITISDNETVNAIAIEQGHSNSAVATAVFTVNIVPVALHSFGSGLEMISAPVNDTGYSLSQIFDQTGIKFAVWNPVFNSYAVSPASPADTVRPGQGYWARFLLTTKLIDIGPHADPTAPVTVALASGWNMIGCPRFSSVTISTLTVEDSSNQMHTFADAVYGGLLGGSLYTYQPGDTAYEVVPSATGSLTPYDGYWLYATQACTLTFPAGQNTGAPPIL